MTDALRNALDWMAANGAPQVLVTRAADELVALQDAQRTGVQPETLAKAQRFMLAVAQAQDKAARQGTKLSLTRAIIDVGYSFGVSEPQGWVYRRLVKSLSSPSIPLARPKARNLTRSST